MSDFSEGPAFAYLVDLSDAALLEELDLAQKQNLQELAEACWMECDRRGITTGPDSDYRIVAHVDLSDLYDEPSLQASGAQQL